jgi:hypothetical protein
MSTLREITYSTGETEKLTGASQKKYVIGRKKATFQNPWRGTFVVIFPTAGLHRARLKLSVPLKDSWIKGMFWRRPQSWPRTENDWINNQQRNRI